MLKLPNIILDDDSKINLLHLVDLACIAGEKIMSVYNTDFSVDYKEDDSPLTQADELSNELICKYLYQHWPKIKIISEENINLPYSARSEEQYIWLVDPLDGTKEFIKRNGQFTVNIALSEYGEPILGVVHIPVEQITYFAAKDQGAFKYHHPTEKLSSLCVHTFSKKEEKLRFVVSSSHLTPETEVYIQKFTSPSLISAGSSLKLLKVAEGSTDIYPRFGPTKEWDTCAAHAILKEAGGFCIDANTHQELRYNKEELRNPFFICHGKMIS